MQSDQIDQLATALVKAQSELEGAKKSAQNPHLRNRYADLGSVWDAVRDPMATHGLSVAQCLCDDDRDGAIVLRTVLMHSSGQWIDSTVRMPYSAGKGVNEAQAAGSAITYARRYALSALLGVCPEDDDAASAGGPREAPARARPAATPAAAPAARGAAAAIEVLPLQDVLDRIDSADSIMALQLILNQQARVGPQRTQEDANTIIQAASERKTELMQVRQEKGDEANLYV